jgi:heat shock protein 5
LIGRRYSDKTVQKDKKLWPFSVVEKDGKPYVRVHYQGEDRTFAPEEISAMVLTRMKRTAESYLGKKVTRAVITVPAYFDDTQRASTKDAGTIAGLDVVRIINEPTAAAIAYGIDRKHVDTNIIVYDLGGGTFDVSLMTLDEGVFEVIATNGNTHLGGQDFDERVMQHLIKVFKRKSKIDIRHNDRAIAKLRREVEKAKRALSSSTQIRIEIENIAEGIDLSETLTRARFEELNGDLFRKTIKPLEIVLKDAGMHKSDIHEIVLVGGSTRIPKIQKMVKDFFGGREPNRGINADEAVAYGAAVQAAILDGNLGDDFDQVVVVDVTPLSLGIETVGKVMTKVIGKNSVIPNSKSQVFTTYEDQQPAVNIRVFQGERALTDHNIFLGDFVLSGIPPAPRGKPQIEVTFAIDVNGILSVSARDKESGVEGSIDITADKGRPSQREIDEMLAAAEEFAEEDERLMESVRTKNVLEARAHAVKRETEDEEAIEAADDILDWLDDNPDADVDDYKEKMAEFQDIVSQILGDGHTPGGGDYEDEYDYDGDFSHEDL